MALRPALVRKLLVVAWTVFVVAAFMGLARVAPQLPTWVLWVAGIVVWMVGNVWLMVRETRQWRRMASTLGLRPEKPIESNVQWLGMPDLVGEYRGRPVAVRTFTSGGHGGSATKEWTVLEAAFSSAQGAPLVDVRAKRWVYGGEPEPGAAAVVTHDAAFDAAHDVFAVDRAHAAQVLSGTVRDTFLALDTPHRTLVEPQRVVQHMRQRLLDPERVRRHQDAVVALADQVERTVD